MSTGLTFGTISSLYGLDAAHHRPHPVLPAGGRCGAFRDRSDRHRPTLVLSPGTPRHPHHLLPPDPSEILIHEPGEATKRS